MKKTVLILAALVMSFGAFAQTVLDPSSEVPGVEVASGYYGNDWGGFNVFLGSDQSVWPFSTGKGDGVVAFTPEPDATYYMELKIISTGATGLRLRWSLADGYSNGGGASGHPQADADAVNSTNFTISQTADFIPAYYNSGDIVPEKFITINSEWFMDGGAAVGGLIGNMAGRGAAGSGAWIVIGLIITDEAGNQLVNYWNFDAAEEWDDVINATSDKQISAIEDFIPVNFFDILGRKIAEPETGIFIGVDANGNAKKLMK